MRLISLILAGLALVACASLSPYAETPSISVTSFAMAPVDSGQTPVFRVGLRVINPNRVALPLMGMSYQVDIQGQRLLSGATADLPEVPAYGSADFTVDLAPDLLGGMRLIGSLMAGPADSLDYRFAARLDVGGWRPRIQVEQAGSFQAGQP